MKGVISFGKLCVAFQNSKSFKAIIKEFKNKHISSMKDYPTFDNSLPFSISDNSSVSVSMNTPLIPTQDPIAQPRMQSMPRQQPQQVQESLM